MAGPRGYTMTIDYFDPKAGGSYRYVHLDGKGGSYAFSGVIHEVTTPERLIQTFEFEGLPEKGHVSLDTAVFESLPGGRTKVTMKTIFQSVADRDGMVRSGMEKGVSQGHERLDELLALGI
ncbi:SRPBCC domain-containing protein [Paraflavitalea speifideaquila]|uniref:SRPBCC domain-containing protein n=1 Tax=Paraflavitalea speifideaquila TaxID=3076558 RepID=UPI0028E20FD8|nr:SRPBCC domain-containing protein [Paraflavitalea speifideiaquila]